MYSLDMLLIALHIDPLWFKYEVVDIRVNTLTESVDVKFFEDIFPFKEGTQNQAPKRSIEEISSNSRNEEETKVAPRKSKRARKPTFFFTKFCDSSY